ncbi:MAG: hypothetical protein FIB07_15875 [Candidatus Methanoperedens sp.]|nr:hypothetical protein [Candidatus Methanoperedens sp.]
MVAELYICPDILKQDRKPIIVKIEDRHGDKYIAVNPKYEDKFFNLAQRDFVVRFTGFFSEKKYKYVMRKRKIRLVEQVEHHIKYKEVDGYDETAWLSVAEHERVHSKRTLLDELGIHGKERHRLTTNAYRRTEKTKTWQQRNRIEFTTHVNPGWFIVEEIRYYPTTGNISTMSRFKKPNV